jgi:hypothetical protein
MCGAEMIAAFDRFLVWALAKTFEPVPIIRLVFFRIFIPTAILLFLASRLLHADDWLSTAGFHPPVLEDDWRQPANIAPISPGAAWTLSIILVIAGLMTIAGALTRFSSAIFAALLLYTTLADRLEAFTVSKLGTCLAIALAFTPCDARYSVDAWWRRRKNPNLPLPTHVSGGNVRFFQITIPVFYFSSGVCKAMGDWLKDPYVLFSHLHDSYQTPVSLFAANHFSPWMWTVMQATTLAFEVGAPLWFAWRITRPYALLYGVAMHTLIGLMFGPVIWFALFLIALLVGI